MRFGNFREAGLPGRDGCEMATRSLGISATELEHPRPQSLLLALHHCARARSSDGEDQCRVEMDGLFQRGQRRRLAAAQDVQTQGARARSPEAGHVHRRGPFRIFDHQDQIPEPCLPHSRAEAGQLRQPFCHVGRQVEPAQRIPDGRMHVRLGREQQWIPVKNARGYAQRRDFEPLALGHEGNRGCGFNGCDLGDAASMTPSGKTRG